MFTSFWEIIFVIWLTVNSLVVFYFWHLLRKLFTGGGRGLRGSIDDSIHKSHTLEKEVGILKENIQEINGRQKNLLQKTAVVRFNPFERVGGEQSHTLVVLTENKDGFLITSLYTREGVRVYLKEIKNGSVEKEALSSEEREAINKALKS